MTHLIEFVEPITYTPEESLPGMLTFGTHLKVSDKVYKMIHEKPMRFDRTDKEPGNAFVFGKLFPLNEYKNIGNMGNDVAQCGFVDVALAMKRYPEDEDWESKTEEDYHYPWKNVVKMRQKFPAVIFFGETVGGDVGADLYAHYGPASGGDIDSLIIDNNCFFPSEE